MFPLPDVSELTGWQGVIAYAILAVSIGVIFLVARTGFLKGKMADPADKHSRAEIAMVAIDSEAVKQLAVAAEALNITLTEIKAIGTQYLTDLRIQRDAAELAAADKRGYDRAMRELNDKPVTRAPRRRSPSK